MMQIQRLLVPTSQILRIALFHKVSPQTHLTKPNDFSKFTQWLQEQFVDLLFCRRKFYFMGRSFVMCCYTRSHCVTDCISLRVYMPPCVTASCNVPDCRHASVCCVCLWYVHMVRGYINRGLSTSID